MLTPVILGRPTLRRTRAFHRWTLPLGAGAYLVLSIMVWWNVWSSHPTSITTCGCGDSSLFTWFLSWPAYAISHGLNPLYSTAMFHPTGVNLLANTGEVGIGVVLAPVTWIFGPVATLNVALTLSPTLSALAMFVLKKKKKKSGSALLLVQFRCCYKRCRLPGDPAPQEDEHGQGGERGAEREGHVRCSHWAEDPSHGSQHHADTHFAGIGQQIDSGWMEHRGRIQRVEPVRDGVGRPREKPSEQGAVLAPAAWWSRMVAGATRSTHTMIESTKYAPAPRGRVHHGKLGFAVNVGRPGDAGVSIRASQDRLVGMGGLVTDGQADSPSPTGVSKSPRFVPSNRSNLLVVTLDHIECSTGTVTPMTTAGLPSRIWSPYERCSSGAQRDLWGESADASVYVRYR